MVHTKIIILFGHYGVFICATYVYVWSLKEYYVITMLSSFERFLIWQVLVLDILFFYFRHWQMLSNRCIKQSVPVKHNLVSGL